MNIVYISTSSIPSRTANSVHVMKMCNALSRNNHEVLLIHPVKPFMHRISAQEKRSHYGIENDFPIREISCLRPNFDHYGLSAALISKKEKPDLVYGRSISGCYWSSLIGLPTVFEAHYPVFKSHRPYFRRMVSRPSFRKLVVISEALKCRFLEAYPELDGRIVVAHDGADEIAEDVKTKLNDVDGRRLQVGYVGHLYPGRGADTIFGLARRFPGMDFHVVGGTEKDINHHSSATRHIDNLTLHGFMRYNEAERFRMDCDVLLAPYERNVSVSGSKFNSVEWMSPLKIFEYMAAGKAILSSDLPVLREVLIDGENALLCNPDDIEDWVLKLKQLEDNREEMARLGNNALKDLQEKYTWRRRADSIIGLIN